MDEKMKKEFIQMLKDARGTDNEWAVIMAMVDLLEDDDEFERLAELHKGKSEYQQFLTEHEAKKAVEGFINYDGSRGAKWPMPAMVWETIERLGGRKAEEGKYNCWAMFAVLNMIHSDYGGAIMTAVQGDAYVKMCYMLAVAWLCDRDERNDVRKHFGFE